MATTRQLTICQDSREQHGLEPHFAVMSDVILEVAVTIKTGDYCLRLDDGELDVYAVERKAVDDFVNSITTTEGQRHEQNKIKRHNEAAGRAMPYVVEGTLYDVLPLRPCPCIHERASLRCKECKGDGFPFCDCVKARPQPKCEFCGGTGRLGYDYGRRKITPQFTIHQISEMVHFWNVPVIFAGSPAKAAAMIKALLTRRYEELMMRSE